MFDDQTFIEEALKIIREAEEDGVVLRLIGALAVRLHCPDQESLHVNLKRIGGAGSFTDIDLIGYSKQRHKIRKIMEDKLKFKVSPQALLMRGKERLVYHHPQAACQVDIFLDHLKFSHDVYLGSDTGKGRLSLDSPTITPTDILLEKIQIHDIAEKDIKDILTIFRAHNISSEEERDSINAEYVATLLAQDWGFWYDAKVNLSRVKNFAKDYHKTGLLTHEDLADISEKISRLLAVVDGKPKTRKWMRGAKKGTSKQWWRSVEELVR